MSISIKDFRMAIRIDNSEARQKFEETRRQIGQVAAAMKKLDDEGRRSSAEYKELKKRHDLLNTSLYRQRLEAGRSALTYNELRQGASRLRRALGNLRPGSDEWKQYRRELQLTEQRMKELRGQATSTGLSISKLSGGFNRYAGMAATALASLTGMTVGMRQAVQDYADMEEALSQVTKYTGMSRDETRLLNEEFKRMDTRTSRQELNRLAGEAGKLGITSREEVMQFVDAANQINVALGEDLGRQAVGQIGKLSQMFGEEGTSLRDNMLAIGSAVNSVAQSTSASEPYLVEFTARMGGVAKQAGLAVTDIMGFASALDQNMLRSEMASTALSGLVMRIFQEPAKYARLAGMDVRQFTDLMQHDANEAVMAFLTALQGMGGMTRMAPVLKEMQLSGAEAASVISTLAGNVALVRREQRNAAEAFRRASSITQEYNVQNQTVQASLDKARKAFLDVRVELGEQLMPVMRHVISTGTLTVKGLQAAVSVFMEYKGAILTLAAAVTSYMAAARLATLWEEKFKNMQLASLAVSKLSAAAYNAKRVAVLGLAAAKAALTGNLTRAAAAWRLLSLAMKANPAGMIVSLVATLAVGIASLASRTDKAASGIKRMYEEMVKETQELDRLFNSLKSTSEGTQRRKELIEEINTKYGEYLPNLLSEKSSLDEIKDAYDRINTALTAHIALKARDSEKAQATEDSARKQMERLDSLREEYLRLMGSDEGSADFIRYIRQMAAETAETSGNFNKSVSRVYATLERSYTGGKKLTGDMRSDIANFMNDVLRLDRELDQIDKRYEGWTDIRPQSGELPEIEIAATRRTADGGSGSVPESGGDDPLADLQERFDQELKARQAAAGQKKLLQMMAGEDELSVGIEYNKALYQAEMEYLLKRKAAMEDYGQDTSEIQGQIYDRMIAEAERLNAQETELREKNRQARLDGLARQEEDARRKAKQAFIAGDLADEEAYQDKLLEIAREFLEKRKELMESFGMDTTAVDGELLDMEFAGKQAADRQEAQDRRDQRDKGFRQIQETASADGKNQILEQMYEADLVSYEEYQEMKTKIAEEQEQARQQITQGAFNAIGQAAQAASQLIAALQERELSKVEARYDREIAAAQAAGQDTARLEEEKEEAMNAVRRKYADKQFAANVLQVTASTAVAAMEAYRAMAGIPYVGPALGALAAAAALAAGAAQIAVAKKQRDEAKGLYRGGYSDEYEQGYTRRGNPREEAGVIPVHRNEFVANHEAVANPAVRQFLDVFDVAQKRGTIRMLNTTQILEQVRLDNAGRYRGGYTRADERPAAPAAATPRPAAVSDEQTHELLREGNRLLDAISRKQLTVDPRQVRDGIRHVERMEQNVSRRRGSGT